jgi:hypothetical protein
VTFRCGTGNWRDRGLRSGGWWATWLVVSCALFGSMPSSAMSAGHGRQNPNVLWQEYPLGTRPLQTPATPPTKTAARGRPSASARSKGGGAASGITLSQVLVAMAFVCVFVAVAPIAVWRRSRRSAPNVQAARHRPRAASASATEPLGQTHEPDKMEHPSIAAAARGNLRAHVPPKGDTEQLIDAVTSATSDAIHTRRTCSATSGGARDDEILHAAAVYAEASTRGDRAPMAAVRASIPPSTPDAAALAKRLIAQARRRGLLTSHGRGNARGELTPKALELLLASPTHGSEPSNNAPPRESLGLPAR